MSAYAANEWNVVSVHVVCAAHKPADAIAYWIKVDCPIVCDLCADPAVGVWYTRQPVGALISKD